MATYSAFVRNEGVDNSTISLSTDKQLSVKAGGIAAAQLASNSVTTAKIADNAVTNAKLGVPAMKSVQFTVAYDDFTDGGAAVGTYTASESIPVGAVATRAFVTSVTGFTGDTSAVLTIGDGTDVYRYNTGTIDVFTTADTLDAGAVSGTAYHSAAKDIVLTVTSDSDFTSVAAGSVTVTVFFYQAEDLS